jgi:hypothetical protein
MERDGDVERKVRIEFCNLPQGNTWFQNRFRFETESNWFCEEQVYIVNKEQLAGRVTGERIEGSFRWVFSSNMVVYCW